MHGSRVFILTALIGGAAFALQVSRPERPDGKQAPIERAVEVEGTDESSVAAGTGGECNEVGAFDESFTFANRYRGNVYRIDKTVSLAAIEMRLGMDGARTLHAAIHQLQPNGDWTRFPEGSEDYVLEITAAQAGGFSSPQFRTALINPPVQLLEGFDYAIGFAWNESIRFGKDIFRTYPQSTPADFSVGTVRGNVAINFTASPLPMDDEIDPFFSNQGAYAMRLCFTGACCSPSGTCTDRTQMSCQSLEVNGEFTAPGISCSDIQELGGCPLPRGACCLSVENCQPYNQFTCESVGGAWEPDVLCGDPVEEPCEPRGGCCSNDGSCQDDHTLGSCQAAGGVYRGDNVGCNASPACNAGACCNGTECGPVAITRQQCEAGGPAFRFAGVGTTCASNPCNPTGACCTPGTTTCTDGLTASQCGSLGRIYRGDGTRCAQLQPGCGKGACCTFETGCEDASGAGITSSLCSVIGGTFHEGESCTTLDPQCPGTCCRGSTFQTCNEGVEPDLCSKLAGVFVGYDMSCPNVPADPDPCDPVNSSTGGACCMHSGDGSPNCGRVSTLELCTQLHGVYHPGMSCTAVSCVPPPPTGACCDRLIGACVEPVEQEDCSGFGKVWVEDGACAEFDPPCLPVGACCDRTNLVCQNSVLEADCEHDWSQQETCNALFPPCAPTGACCLAQNCRIETEASCFTLGGNYQGDDMPCGAKTCAPRGACCMPDESCTLGTELACGQAGGAYQGDDSTCANEICVPLGACCEETGCSQTTEEGCNGTFEGDGTICGVDGCLPTGACCIKFECFIRTSGDCQELGGTYQNDGSTCEGDICDPTGACCVDEDCSIATEVGCTGEYQGDGTACGVDTCIETGACCDVNDSCSIQRPDDCTAGGGTYVGEDTTCENAPCAVGGCCDTTCTCIDDSQRFRCEAASGQFFEAQACDSVTCPVKIAGSDFPDCAIDAREHPPQPGALAPEIDSFTITMSCASLNTVAEDFVVENVPPIEPPAEPSAIDHVMIDDTTTVHVMLTAPIPPDHYTCVAHMPSNSRICVGYLPGDANGDGITNTDDIEALVMNLGADPQTLESWQCDADRSTVCTPLDILRNIQLQSGEEPFDFWSGHQLSDCPNTAP